MLYKERFKQIKALLLGYDPGLASLFFKYFYNPQNGSMTHLLDQKLTVASGKKDFTFLQIGGNDGFTNDPIFKLIKRHSCKGIIVEPQKEVFEKRLKKTYRFEKKVILENLAISDKSGERKLYKISVSNSRWATGLASFSLPHLEEQIKNGYVAKKAAEEGIALPDSMNDCIGFELVNCITISDLLKKHHFDALDFLQMDTEGYDFEIIKTIDFSKILPSIITFENYHLSATDKAACEVLLRHHGYQIDYFGNDTIAYQV